MKKRGWLRFGLIFAAVAFFVSIPSIFMAFGFNPNILGGPFVTSVSSLIILPVQFLMNPVGTLLSLGLGRENIYLVILMMALIPSVFYFIIGAIVGHVYSKTKNQDSPLPEAYVTKKMILFFLLLIIIGFGYFILVNNKSSSEKRENLYKIELEPPQ